MVNSVNSKFAVSGIGRYVLGFYTNRNCFLNRRAGLYEAIVNIKRKQRLNFGRVKMGNRFLELSRKQVWNL
jgi:hypothetical protein